MHEIIIRANGTFKKFHVFIDGKPVGSFNTLLSALLAPIREYEWQLMYQLTAVEEILRDSPSRLPEDEEEKEEDE